MKTVWRRSQADFALSAGMRQSLTERQYLAYIAFTRPSQFLYVTYPLSDDAGSDMVRSQFVDNLQSLFENLKRNRLRMTDEYRRAVSGESELAELLDSQLGKDNPQLVPTEANLKHYLTVSVRMSS